MVGKLLKYFIFISLQKKVNPYENWENPYKNWAKQFTNNMFSIKIVLLQLDSILLILFVFHLNKSNLIEFELSFTFYPLIQAD